MSILNTLRARQSEGKKSIAVLIDPDKVNDSNRLQHVINLANENCVDFFFVGGSLVTTTNLSEALRNVTTALIGVGFMFSSSWKLTCKNLLFSIFFSYL